MRILKEILFWIVSVLFSAICGMMFYLKMKHGNWLRIPEYALPEKTIGGIIGGFIGIWITAILAGYIVFRLKKNDDPKGARRSMWMTARIFAIVFGLCALLGALIASALGISI